MAKEPLKNIQPAAISKRTVKVLSFDEQNDRIYSAAYEMLSEANRDFAGTRRITKRACNSVVARSIKKNADQSYTIRRLRALKELGHYIQLAQHNKIFASRPENTDLLPIAHPRSTRSHELTTAELMKHRARWITDDPHITDDTARSVLASALVAHPASAEYEYSIARLQGLPQGTIPQYALLAALGDGNSSAARRARAMKQRRDRKGRFAEMGGGLRAFVKRASGVIQSLTGKAVSQGIEGDTFDMELPDGKLIRVPTSSVEGVKAVLKSQQGPDGFSKTPAKTSSKDPILDEANLEVIDAPSGFTKDETWAPTDQDLEYYGTKIDLGTKYTDDAYDVIKFDSPNAAAKDKFEAAQQRESEGQNVVTEGLGKNGSLDPNLPVYMVTRRGESDGKPFAAVQSWADVQDYISQDEPKFEKGELPDPSKMLNDGADAQAPAAKEEKPQEGDLIPAIPNLTKAQKRQYKQDMKNYEKNGGLMPLDPSKSHIVMPDGSVIDAETGEVERPALPTGKAVPPTPAVEDSEVPQGAYKMDPEPYTPKGAGPDVESKDYTDDPAELAQKFDEEELTSALEDSLENNGSAQLPFEAGDESVPAESVRDALGEMGKDIGAAVKKAYSKIKAKFAGKKESETPEVSDEVKAELGKDLPEAPTAEGSDPAALPALLDGLGDAEKEEYTKTGDYAKHLPKNETTDAPEGYTELNPDPFNNDEALLPEDAPDGFTFNPVDIANDYSTEDLKAELRRAIEPGNEMPGYGILGQKTEEGEDYVGNVPGEAIRDALQLQGEDTNKLIDDIYKEGAEQPSAQEIADAVEGENAKEEPAQPAESPAQDAQGPDADQPKAGLPSDSEAGGVQGIQEAGNVGEPTGPAKLSTKAGELKAGDVTADKFTVEKVYSDEESEAIKPGSVWVEGYYPGHATQKTKLWNKDTEIDVYRNVDAPVKGDLPALSKPKPKEYDPEGKIYKDKELGLFVPKDAEARSKFLDAMDQYNAQLAEAQAKWDAPEGLENWSSESTAPTSTPANPVAVVSVPATDVQAGDIAFKKEYGATDFEYFVVESYEGINPETGKAQVKGFYPGHESQLKEWNAGTQITVMRGAKDLPAAGTKSALERPSKDDPDYKAKKAEFDKAKAESAATFTPPLSPEAAPSAGAKLKRPTGPAFDGDKLKALAAEANGDPAKFKELLNNETIVSIDFETDGSKDFSKQNPIQVAITKTKNGQQVEEPLVLFMNPEQPLGPFYTDAPDQDAILKDSDGNPISDEFLAKQQSMDEAFAKVAEYLGSDPIIIMAHNSPFDVPILKKYMEQGGHTLNIEGEIDTLALARKVGKLEKGNDLKSVVSKYFPEKSDLNWHDAATDVSVLPDIMNALLDDMITTKSGVEQLDIDGTKAQYAKDLEAYKAQSSKAKKIETDQAASKVVADAFAGKEIPATSAELEDKLPKALATSDELSSATTNPNFPTSDGINEVESVLGGLVSDNWVADSENTTNIGKIFAGEWQPGDFISAPYGGYFEILEVIPDPDNEKNVFVRRRLLSTGEVYGGPGDKNPKSWMKYGQYEVWRRNSAAVDESPETPEVEQPQLETDEAPKKEASAGKWNDYTISQGTDGVYYAENISAADVAALRNGTLTPPNLPFFAPLGGGSNQETGEGYFFTSDGKRFWGKYGASGALVRRKNADGEYEYFMAKRSQSLSQGGGKWGAPGGAHKDQTMAKTVGATAKEEFLEEVGGDLSNLEPIYSDNNMVGAEWGYETFVFEVGPNQLNDLGSKDGENTDIGWFTADQINKMGEEGKLHPDFAASFPGIVNAVDLQETKALDKPTPADEITETEVASVFDISKWQKTGGQEGSNKGAYYTDPDTGIEYYVKTPKSDKHAANEVLGGALYDEAGTKFGRAHLGVDKNGKTVLVSPILDGSNKDFAEKKNDPEFKKKAQEDFAVDAWLGNYDATGLAFDNMLTKGGDLYRVDAGGSLLFRAQGGTDKDFGPEATQIDSMRDAKTNPQAAEIFGDMTDEQIAESVKKVQAVTPEKIDELVDAAFAGDPKTADMLKETLKARREYLINRFLGGQEAPEAPEAVEAPTIDSNTSVINVSDDPFEIQNQIQDAIADGKKIAFKYKGKERLVTPKYVYKNPKNGNLNLKGLDQDGVEKTYTLQNFEQSNGTAPEAFNPEAPATPKAEPVNEAQVVQVPEAEKAAVLDEVSNLAEKLFGSKEKTKDLLESLKGQDGVNNDIIDAILSDINAPSTPEDATPEQKIESDITEALTPDADIDETAPEGLGEIDPAALAEELKTPLTPDLIWQKVKDEYGAKTLENGHIVVGTSDDGTSVINTVVKRNADNTFSVYHRILNKETGETKIKTYAGKWHSFTALKSRIDTNIWKSAAKPKTVKNGSKAETPGSVLPAAVPTQKGSYVSADGKTPIKVGMKVRTIEMKSDGTKVEKTGTVISLKDEYTTGKSKAKPEGYTYTDVAKVKWDDSGKKNWKVSSYLEIIDASGAKETPEKPKNDGEEGGGTGGTPVEPKTPNSPAPVTPVDTPEVSVPTFEGADLAGATAIKDVEAKSVAKNSDGHLSAYGANNYSDYKSFLSGEFIKDPESKNLVPGILVQNDKLNSEDPELVSYGVVSSQNAKTGDIEVSYFDGPLAGKKQTLKSDKVWSREKFITPEQAKELDITIDSTLFDKSKAAAKAKGEEYAKQQAEKAAKAKAKAEADALKNKFQVNGPGFQVQTLDAAEVDFSQSPVEGVPSMDEALDAVKKANTPLEAAKGASTLVDADSIEDLDVHVGLVTDKDGNKKIRLQFTLTDWAANARIAEMQDDPSVKKTTKLKVDKWKKNPDGSLTWMDTWDNSTIDSSGNGVTYSGTAGAGEFKIHRAAKGIDDVDFFQYHSSSPYAVAFHNKVEILLPENATSTDVAQALQELGAVSQVRPATKEDIKGVIENKMIWMYGNATDGKKNFAGELRQKTLDNIKDKYGFTADDVEVVVDTQARGRVNYYIPEAAVEKLLAETGASSFFVHNWKGGSGNTVDWYYDMIMSGGIYATANRWMNGINVSGMSSAADIKANGGNYVFMSPSSKGTSTSSSLAVYFDARKVLRRLDFYKNNSDKFGQLQSDGEDIAEQLKNNYGELMFKKNLSWADVNTISMPSEIRKQLIEKLTAAGETELADMVAGKQKKKGAK
jgi:DNA polymerase III epsilon subunit-like protein